MSAQTPAMNGGPCRSCGALLELPVTDLGMSPPCESYLTAEQLHDMEEFFPLDVWVCETCWLVQLPDHITPEETFVEYAYFSSFSDAWLDHCRDDAHTQIDRWNLGPDCLVVEFASNDGYMLQWFVERGVPVLGVEPARNIAAQAVEARVSPRSPSSSTRNSPRSCVADGHRADLLAGKNVLAQIPDLNPLSAGLQARARRPRRDHHRVPAPAAADRGQPVRHDLPRALHLLLVDGRPRALRRATACRSSTSTSSRPTAARCASTPATRTTPSADLRAGHRAPGARRAPSATSTPGLRVVRRAGPGHQAPTAADLIDAKARGNSIVGYGAAGKGMTMLNYCGIRTDLVDFVVDRNPYKHGRFCPGSHIPILPVEAIDERRPDVVLILPWNLETRSPPSSPRSGNGAANSWFPDPEARVVPMKVVIVLRWPRHPHARVLQPHSEAARPRSARDRCCGTS